MRVMRYSKQDTKRREMQKSVAKWVVDIIILPAIVVALRKQIFKLIDKQM